MPARHRQYQRQALTRGQLADCRAHLTQRIAIRRTPGGEPGIEFLLSIAPAQHHKVTGTGDLPGDAALPA